MEVIQFFEKQRADYLKAIEIAFSRIDINGEYEAVVEPIDHAENNDNKTDKLFSFFRYDILVRKPHEESYYEVKVNVTPAIFTPPLVFHMAGMEISIESFVWNAGAFRFSGFQFKPDMLIEWYDKWIQPEQNEIVRKVQEVIHSVVIPDGTENENLIVIDFGSIPVLGLIGLFDILSGSGIRKLVIRSFYE